jgi:hypothetical protein
MDRQWLITWTCYGTWLPGTARGFVGNVRDMEANKSSTTPGEFLTMPTCQDSKRMSAHT